MGKMIKEISNIEKIKNMKIETDFIEIQFETSLLGYQELNEIAEILKGFGYLEDDYLVVLGFGIQTYGVKISFTSKLYGVKFY